MAVHSIGERVHLLMGTKLRIACISACLLLQVRALGFGPAWLAKHYTSSQRLFSSRPVMASEGPHFTIGTVVEI